jgi:outer membrane protein assembly factor BamE
MRNLIILLAVLCASCGTALQTVKPYKLTVQQGNVVTSKMLLQLRPGMTKSQVRFVMGTPLIQDSFHGNRWDYVYQMRESGKVIEQRRVILDFENDLLKTVRGDVIPSASDKAATEENIGTRVINPSAKPEEKSLMNMLKFWQKDEAEIAKNKALEKAKALEEIKALEKANALEKEKLEADEAAKKASKSSLGNAAPNEQTQSMSVVPVELAPLVEVPVIGALPVEVPVVILPETKAPVSEARINQIIVIEAPVIQIEKPAPVQVESKVQAAITESTDTSAVKMPVKPESYDSTTGMKFDRKLLPDAEETSVEAAIASKSGRKVVPKPKDVPIEDTPSFFDKMLEKIGF